MHTMLSTAFCCPVCKRALSSTPVAFHCDPCARSFQVVDGIPDFFLSESGHDFSRDPNSTWLEPHIVEARETVCRHCTRELAGMTFCMHEIGRRTSTGCRVLENRTFHALAGRSVSARNGDLCL